MYNTNVVAQIVLKLSGEQLNSHKYCDLGNEVKVADVLSKYGLHRSQRLTTMCIIKVLAQIVLK